MFQIQVGRFQNISERTQILGCLIFSNLVNTNVAIFIKYQPRMESNHKLCVESIKIEKERGVCHIKLFLLD